MTVQGLSLVGVDVGFIVGFASRFIIGFATRFVTGIVAGMPSLGTIQEWVVVALIVVGCLFVTVGTIGLLRFPNVYNRMHATSKPTTLGTATIFVAGAIYFVPEGATLTAVIGLVFLFVTVPTGAHMIARSAQKTGVPFLGGVTWPGDTDGVDDLEDGAMGEDGELKEDEEREGDCTD